MGAHKHLSIVNLPTWSQLSSAPREAPICWWRSTSCHQRCNASTGGFDTCTSIEHQITCATCLFIMPGSLQFSNRTQNHGLLSKLLPNIASHNWATFHLAELRVERRRNWLSIKSYTSSEHTGFQSPSLHQKVLLPCEAHDLDTITLTFDLYSFHCIQDITYDSTYKTFQFPFGAIPDNDWPANMPLLSMAFMCTGISSIALCVQWCHDALCVAVPHVSWVEGESGWGGLEKTAVSAKYLSKFPNGNEMACMTVQPEWNLIKHVYLMLSHCAIEGSWWHCLSRHWSSWTYTLMKSRTQQLPFSHASVLSKSNKWAHLGTLSIVLEAAARYWNQNASRKVLLLIL